MRQLEPPRVQPIASLSWKRRIGVRSSAADVQGIADERMAGGRQMDTDLMGPSGRDDRGDERSAPTGFEHAHVRDRRLSRS